MKKISEMTDLELFDIEGNDERMTEVEDFYSKKYSSKISNQGGNPLTYRQSLREVAQNEM